MLLLGSALFCILFLSGLWVAAELINPLSAAAKGLFVESLAFWLAALAALALMHFGLKLARGSAA